MREQNMVFSFKVRTLNKIHLFLLNDHIQTPKAGIFLTWMIQVGHEMDLTILTEGVEKECKIQILSEMGCDIIQGFRFNSPVPDSSVRKKLFCQGS